MKADFSGESLKLGLKKYISAKSIGGEFNVLFNKIPLAAQVGQTLEAIS